MSLLCGDDSIVWNFFNNNAPNSKPNKIMHKTLFPPME